MIYKGHDIRVERGHVRVTEMKTGASWTEDTISEAKKTIDVIKAVKLQSADLYGKMVKEGIENED